METPGYLYGLPSSDFFHIDDLLDFSNEEVFGPLTDTVTTATSTISMTETTENRPSNDGSLHRNFADGQDPTELCVPSDDLAELEWLSNFVEESFSAVGFSFPSGADGSVNTNFRPETSVPGRARSKRSRAAVHNWTSRIMTHSPSSSTDSDLPQMGMLPETGKVTAKTGKKKEIPSGSASDQFPGRKCTHCCTEKTPQWRTGPMGPKTLCNACGVRYKSGRLVPEYRPAASPTFVLTQHSNSHRKVMELRRQKEIRQENREFFIHDRQQDFKVY